MTSHLQSKVDHESVGSITELWWGLPGIGKLFGTRSFLKMGRKAFYSVSFVRGTILRCLGEADELCWFLSFLCAPQR